MSEERTPYNVRRVTRPLPITPEADAVTILARENHDLKQNIAEVRRILLALVEEIEELTDYGQGTTLRLEGIELQMLDAREVLSKAGLL